MMSERRVALVTGAARRLGRALAVALAERDHDVVVHYHRRREEAAETAAAVEALGGRALAISANLAAVDEVDALFREIRERFGRLDVLIHNASRLDPQPLRSLSWEQWRAGLAPLDGAFLCCQHALQLMESQSYGRVINITDSSAERIQAADEHLPYRVGKSGILMLTKAFARAATRYNVTVNAIAPGTLADSQTRPPVETIPAGRYAGYHDIVQTMDFLLDPRSDYISGASIKVSGGWDL